MASVISDLINSLTALSEKISTQMASEEAFSLVHNNWSFPSISKFDLLDRVDVALNLLIAHQDTDVTDYAEQLKSYVSRVNFLTNSTVPQIWNNPVNSVPAFWLTLSGLENLLKRALHADPAQQHVTAVRRAASTLRTLEGQLKKVSSRVENLEQMITRIEDAYHSAEQLPADLALLSEARQDVSDLQKAVQQDFAKVRGVKEEVEGTLSELHINNSEADKVLRKCESAYAASTSVGLASAFTDRSNELRDSMKFWIIALAVSLVLGCIIGFIRIVDTQVILENPASSFGVVFVNLLVSVFAIGAPVWFAWLSTKQIGQRFKLAEDYAFKASVSRAYEGFRREAERHGSEMEARVLSSALTRIEELPLRLIDPQNHGSPVHEIAKSMLPNGKPAVRAVCSD